MMKNRAISDLRKIVWDSSVRLVLDTMPTPAYVHPKFGEIWCGSQRFSFRDFSCGTISADEFYTRYMLPELVEYFKMRLALAEKHKKRELYCFIYAAPLILGKNVVCPVTYSLMFTYFWRRAEIMV